MQHLLVVVVEVVENGLKVGGGTSNSMIVGVERNGRIGVLTY